MASDSGRPSSSALSAQRAGTRHGHHVVVGQMDHGGPDVGAVLYRPRDAGRKFAAMNFAAGAARFHELVLGDFGQRTGNVEHLPSLDDLTFRQGAVAVGAMIGYGAGHDVIGGLALLQRVSWVPFLTTALFLVGVSVMFRRAGLLAIATQGGRLARVATVQGQTSFQFGDFRRQRGNLFRQLPNQCSQRPQLPNQLVFFGNAEAVKVGQVIHALSYRLSLSFLKPRIAMLFRPYVSSYGW